MVVVSLQWQDVLNRHFHSFTTRGLRFAPIIIHLADLDRFGTLGGDCLGWSRFLGGLAIGNLSFQSIAAM